MVHFIRYSKVHDDMSSSRITFTIEVSCRLQMPPIDKDIEASMQTLTER